MDNLDWYNFDDDFEYDFINDQKISMSLDDIINNISLDREDVSIEEIPELLKIQLQNPRFKKMYDERQEKKKFIRG